MNMNALADVRVNDLTKTQSSGIPVNVHVVPSPASTSPDYEKMRQLVHLHQHLAPAQKVPAA